VNLFPTKMLPPFSFVGAFPSHFLSISRTKPE